MVPDRRNKDRRTTPSRRDEITRVEALELAMANLPIGIGVFAGNGRAIYLNRKFCELYEIDETSIGNASFDEAIAAGHFDKWSVDPREFFAELRAPMDAGRTFRAEIGIGDRIVRIIDAPLPGGLIVSTQTDVTERVAAERRVAHLARHDPLTELANRTAFNERLADVLDTKKVRHGKFAVLTADLDRFKDVNDIFGHHAGDMLLKEVSARFRQSSGADFIARLGGDEFAFVSECDDQPEAAGVIANHLLDTVASEIECDGSKLMVGISVGIAVYPDDGQTAAELLKNADAALYRAKADGRGVIRSFSPRADRRIRDQRLLQQQLRMATARREFIVHYQPQSTIEGRITGFEALLRWNHPTRGLIEANEFVPLAEENGLIVEIGAWVLREACREAAGWTEPLRISVNLSPAQLRYGDLASRLHAILIETGLAPERLEVEITETALVTNHSRAISVLRRIKNLGVQVAMDDFGTGYSSLSYLQAFPFDALKIDRSFIARLGEDADADQIVRAVIGLARGLRLPIVAQGVENSRQLAFLSGENCESVQGHLIGNAGPIDRYREIVGGVAPLRPLAAMAR